MLWGKKVLRIVAAAAVAFAAAHTAESRKGQTAQQPLVMVATEPADASSATVVLGGNEVVPRSASLAGHPGQTLGDLISITPVAGITESSDSDHCRPSMDLSAAPGAMILLSLSAPCNRNERIIVRHSGLSFTARTETGGTARILLPALKTDAMVAVYLADAHLVLGKVDVPEVASFTRYAIAWEWPTELELRATEGEKVLVGAPASVVGAQTQVISLGVADVQSPVMASVYSVPGKGLGAVDLTGELRITPASCGRTLRLGTIYSAAGEVSAQDQMVAVPLCGTAGDILVLKNLGAALTLAAPK
ncbi:MAG: hypothetical protein ACKO2N_06665 [Tabrizicola sp.]